MKVKLMLFVMLMTVAATITNAQKTTVGLRGGINFFNITGKFANGDKRDNNLKTGFNFGANAEIPVGIDFFVQPGVIYITKGAKSTSAGTEYNTKIDYIEVPVNLLYKPELGKGKLLLGFGPYVAFGVGGKVIVHTSGGEQKLELQFENEIPSGGMVPGNAYMKRFDAGANFLFGYEFANRFSVQLNAGLGLVNTYPKIQGMDTGKSSAKNTGFGVSVGYRFAR